MVGKVYPIIPLMTAAYYYHLKGISLSFEVTGITLHSWIVEIFIANHYGVQYRWGSELYLKFILEILVKHRVVTLAQYWVHHR